MKQNFPISTPSLIILCSALLMQPITAQSISLVYQGMLQQNFYRGMNSVAVSLDGKHVYATAYTDNALSFFNRDTATGNLGFLGSVKDGLNGVDGLAGANLVAVSPDDRHVYVTGSAEQALAFFRRDSSTGLLTYVGVAKQGVGGVTAMQALTGLTVSPDGKFVYVVPSSDHVVTYFARDSVTGVLTYVGFIVENTCFQGVQSLAISPDNRHLYTVNSSQDGVCFFNRNISNGAISYTGMLTDGVGGVNGLNGARSMVFTRDGRHAYIAAAFDNGVSFFSRDSASGALAYIGVIMDGSNGANNLDLPYYVSTSPDGGQIYVASYPTNTVSVLGRNPTSGMLTYTDEVKDSVNGADGLNGVNSMALSSDGRNLYAVGNAENALGIFDRAASTGSLTFRAVIKGGIGGLAGANAVVFSPDGLFAYSGGAVDDALVICSHDTASGGLSYLDRVVDNIGGVDGLDNVVSIAISPDGRHLYAAGTLDNAVALFSRNAMTGTLTYVDWVKDGINGADGLAGVSSIVVSPDGGFVYAAGASDNALSVFSRNPATGMLTYAGMVKDSVNGVDGLYHPVSVAISPDGKHIYAVANFENALSFFSRDSVTGILTYAGLLRDGTGGVDGLNRPTSVTVSPDGRQIYATGGSDNAVAFFIRNNVSGMLTYTGVAKNGVNGVQGLTGVNDVRVSPDGKQVYAASPIDDALTFFNRDSITGLLLYVGQVKDMVNGVDGLDGVTSIGISPNGKHVYGAAFADYAVSWFEIRGGTTFIKNHPQESARNNTPFRLNSVSASRFISYSLTRSVRIEMSIHDPAGRLIKVLIDGEQAAGTHRIESPAGNGVYLLRATVGGTKYLSKLVVTK